MKKVLFLCFAILSAPLINAQVLNISIITTDESCFPSNDGSASANVSGGTPPYVYSWSPAASVNNPAAQTVSGLAAGSYFVTVSDVNGNTQSATAIVNAASGPAVNTTIIGPTCPGDANGQILISVNSGTPPYTYLWSDASTVANRSNLVAGNYSVTIVDANGCSSTQSTTVVDPLPIVKTVSQNGLLLTADQSNAMYQWLDCSANYAPISGANAQSYNASLNGLWAVEINFNGCIDTSSCLSTFTIGIDEKEENTTTFEIFPNPSNGKVFLKGDITGKRLRVFDLSGKVVLEEQISKAKNSVELHHIEKGIYFIEVDQVRKKLVLVE